MYSTLFGILTKARIERELNVAQAKMASADDAEETIKKDLEKRNFVRIFTP